MATAIATRTVRAEVLAQRSLDANRESSTQTVLHARMAGVIGAQRALRDGEVGAAEALRGALVDLASVSELLAEEIE